MVSDDEIMKFLQESKALLDYYYRSKAFAEAIWIELKPIPIEFFPYMEAQCQLNEEKIRTETLFHAECLYNCLVRCIAEDERNAEGYTPITYRTRQYIVERQQRMLEKLLAMFEPEKHDFIYKMCAQDNVDDLPHEEFMFKCHDKAKAVILQFFPEITEMCGNTIRMIDNMTHTEIGVCVQSFYEHSDYDNITKSIEEAGKP